jgi:hypothetical protein
LHVPGFGPFNLAKCICRVVANLFFFLDIYERKFAFAKLAQENIQSCIYFKIAFCSGVGVKFAQSSPAKGKQKPIPKEMFQTLLTNKKQGNLDYVHTANIIKPT